jgi:site-specific DNA-methyltransferase (adenine-specific)
MDSLLYNQDCLKMLEQNIISDVDIRELTSGYFAGEEVIRTETGERFHKQQAPIALLVRILLSSSKVGDKVFDPFAGTGTTLVVSKQLKRNSVGIEIDPLNVKLIEQRISNIREIDKIDRYYETYQCTDKLPEIWGVDVLEGKWI